MEGQEVLYELPLAARTIKGKVGLTKDSISYLSLLFVSSMCLFVNVNCCSQFSGLCKFFIRGFRLGEMGRDMYPPAILYAETTAML